MNRVDISETLNRITFPDEVWSVLDLLGEIIRVTDEESLRRDRSFVADTLYKKLLVAGVHKQITSFKALYLLLRAEFGHQAAGHVRLCCEGLISLRFISLAPNERAPLFWDYSYIEAYEAAKALLEWERSTAAPAHVAALEARLATLKIDYDRVHPNYQFTDRRGKVREFQNWCNRSIADQAKECGTAYERLYRIVYAQMSAYVHGSAWSLRHVSAYSPRGYDPERVLWDFIAIILATTAVWVEFASFVKDELAWDLQRHASAIVAKANRLSARAPNPDRT